MAVDDWADRVDDTSSHTGYQTDSALTGGRSRGYRRGPPGRGRRGFSNHYGNRESSGFLFVSLCLLCVFYLV